jgi:hypothetical protein
MPPERIEPDLPSLPTDDEIEAWPGRLIELPPTTAVLAPVTLTVEKPSAWVAALQNTNPHLTVKVAE